MTIQNLDFGTSAANDGETLFDAFTKVQDNFESLFNGNGSHAVATIASASTCDLGAVEAPVVRITGTTTITSFGTTANCKKILIFVATPTVTYNATSLILPGNVNWTPVAGDCAIVVSDDSGNWRAIFVSPSSLFYQVGGTDVAITDGGTGASTATAGFDNLAPTTTRGDLIVRGASNNGRLAVGAANRILKSDGTDPSWATLSTLLDTLSSTQGAVLYRGASSWTTTSVGTSGYVLKAQGAGADPIWEAVAGTGDVTAAANYGTDNSILRADGTGKGSQSSALTIADTTGTIAGFANASSLNDSSGNELIKFGVTASAVNEVTATNAATGNPPVLSATGGDTNITLRLNGKGTGGAAVLGTSTNDNASSGYVGEVLSASVASGSAVSLTTVTAANVTSVSLTAGDWDVRASVAFSHGTTTQVTEYIVAINTTSATIGAFDSTTSCTARLICASVTPGAVSTSPVTPMPIRISVSTTTTVYLVARGAFTVSTLAAYGIIWARRAR
jgi:hypothetical protein